MPLPGISVVACVLLLEEAGKDDGAESVDVAPGPFAALLAVVRAVAVLNGEPTQ